ncbi:hypothetical protein [Chitinophaga caseinilytica]|uniref:PH (Pleckstrin Homology) domain-containing protein n=1 Tax=Chitinophaga caseinilytica TaxID=2267521 RepID=A0ABZ2Z0G5_9BACT
MALFSSFFGVDQFKLIFLIAGLLSLWVGGMFTDHDIIGNIKITANEIVVEKPDCVELFDLQELQSLKFQILGIKGEFYSMNSIAIKQGSDNIIMFNYYGEKKEYLFLLEEPQAASLKTIFEAWKQSNIEFRVDNKTHKRLHR